MHEENEPNEIAFRCEVPVTANEKSATGEVYGSCASVTRMSPDDACERLHGPGHVHCASDSWDAPAARLCETTARIDQKSEEGVFRRGHEKTGTAGFTRHTAIDAARLAVDEIAGV
jgi:hypothetical protein